MDNNTYRFFVDPASFSEDGVLVRDRELAHQLSAVLRLRAGARVTFLDGSGAAYRVCLKAIEGDRVSGAVEEQWQAGGEPTTSLTLCAPLIKSERFEWLLQKGTELGVSRFIPMVSAHSLPGEIGEAKLARWRRIVREAAEQSRRGLVPALERPQPFKTLCGQAGPQGLLLWEGAPTVSLRAALQRHGPTITILSGPEGGFSPAEVTLAHEHGLSVVTLGARTLRAETAPLAAASAILYERGDFE